MKKDEVEVLKVTSLAALRNLLEMQILRPHSWPSESESGAVGAGEEGRIA